MVRTECRRCVGNGVGLVASADSGGRLSPACQVPADFPDEPAAGAEQPADCAGTESLREDNRRADDHCSPEDTRLFRQILFLFMVKI